MHGHEAVGEPGARADEAASPRARFAVGLMGRVAWLALLVTGSMASGPTLSSFEMDMTQGMLTLTWSQLMFPKSINASAVILQSNVSRGSRMHHLRLAGSVPLDANSNSTTFT